MLRINSSILDISFRSALRNIIRIRSFDYTIKKLDLHLNRVLWRLLQLWNKFLNISDCGHLVLWNYWLLWLHKNEFSWAVKKSLSWIHSIPSWVRRRFCLSSPQRLCLGSAYDSSSWLHVLCMGRLVASVFFHWEYYQNINEHWKVNCIIEKNTTCTSCIDARCDRE